MMLLVRFPVLVTVQPPARKRPAAVSASPVLFVLFSTTSGMAFDGSVEADGDDDDDGATELEVGALLGAVEDTDGLDTVELWATADVRSAA